MPCGRPGRGTQQFRSHPKPFWDRDTPSYPRTGQGWVGQDPPAQIDPPHLKGVRPLLAARQGWGSTGNPGAPPPPSVGAQWNQVWGQQVTRQEPGRAAQPQMTRTRTTASVHGLGVCSSPGRWGLMCVCHVRLPVVQQNAGFRKGSFRYLANTQHLICKCLLGSPSQPPHEGRHDHPNSRGYSRAQDIPPQPAPQ